jgi:hypothetical protein
MRKFTENLSSNDLFGDVENLKLLLVEFGDYNLTYTINYHLQKYDEDNLFAFRTSDKGFEDLDILYKFSTANYDNNSYIRAYIIRFRKTYDILTADQQRNIDFLGTNGRTYGIPTSKTYGFMEVAQDVQHKVEQLGHTFALAMRDSEFDIMILEGKHK